MVELQNEALGCVIGGFESFGVFGKTAPSSIHVPVRLGFVSYLAVRLDEMKPVALTNPNHMLVIIPLCNTHNILHVRMN